MTDAPAPPPASPAAPAPAAPPARAVRFAEVALNVPVDKTFVYTADGSSGAEAGKRAEVLFRGRKMTAYIIAVRASPPADGFPEERLKPLSRVIDAAPVFTERHAALARWMADYYASSVGEALGAMIPSGRRDSGAPGFPLQSGEEDFARKTLTAEQQRAVDAICADFSPAPSAPDAAGGAGGADGAAGAAGSAPRAARVHYLYGVTGSGKTEVFLQAAEAALALGRGVLYLVPEIALTFQTVRAVSNRFGRGVAVLHSGLTPSQRIREWRRIMAGDAPVVVGARSAVFAPLPRPALIIIDEEHDSSYKSASSPRYHARQAALHIAALEGIPLVMGSATPSVEAWRLMREGRFVTHRLTARAAGGKPPEITAVDLSRSGGSGAISPLLRRELEAALAEGRQAILFLNRRGFTHIFRCNTCGFELICRNCSVPLTFHKSENRLRCHYCGWTAPPPDICPHCSSVDVGYRGFGTEYIEEETRALFPRARVERLDADSAREAGGAEAALDAFRAGGIDILLGTQMVAKGLNFPRLKLVGVIAADTGLSMPDFRSAERCFALITQVAGRAGRFFPDGRVIVQSFNPARPAIALACRGMTDAFYEQELEARRALGFPPFSRLVRLVFRAARQAAAERAAQDAAAFLRRELARGRGASGGETLGPAECPLAKIAANYRVHILLRGPRLLPLRRAARAVRALRLPPGVYVEIDVDPVSLL